MKARAFRGIQLSGILKYSFALSQILNFVVILLSALPYLNLPNFSDEDDNILGGMSIAAGNQIYVDYYSQHTPGMYFLMSVAKLLGANSLAEYRFYFYFVFASAVVALRYIYRKDFDSKVIFIFSVIYMASLIANYEWSYTVVSEHVQVLAYSGLFLEVVRSARRLHFSGFRWLLIGTYSLVAIGVAFLSIYFVFAAIVSVLWNDSRIDNSKKFMEKVFDVSRNLLVSGVPALSFLIYMKVTGAFSQMVDQAYILNKTVYLGYLEEPYPGNGPLAPLFNVPNIFWSYFKYSFNSVKEMGFSGTRDALNILIGIFFIASAFKYRKSLGFITCVLLLVLPVRGTTGFHALPYWGVTALMASMLIANVLNFRVTREEAGFKWSNSVRAIGVTLSFICVLLLALPYANFVRGHRSQPSFLQEKIVDKNVAHEYSKRALVDAIHGEIFQTSIDVHLFVDMQKNCDYHVCGIVPWFYEVYGEDILKALEKNPPKLIFHNSDNEVWGYRLKNYAPGLDRFINLNYERLPLKVRGYIPDFYEDAYILKKESRQIEASLGENLQGISCYQLANNSNFRSEPIGEITSKSSLEFTFRQLGSNLNSVTVPIATYGRKNTKSIFLSLTDASGRELAKSEVDASTIMKQGFAVINFDPIENSNNKMYTLKLSSPQGKTGDAFTAWFDPSSQGELSDLKFANEKLQGSVAYSTYVQNDSFGQVSQKCTPGHGN